MQSSSDDELAPGELCFVLRHGATKKRRAVVVDKRPAETGSQDEYYIHYEGTDRRLDEWAQRSQIQKILVPKDVSSVLFCRFSSTQSQQL